MLIQAFYCEHLPKRIALDFQNKEYLLENCCQALCRSPQKKMNLKDTTTLAKFEDVGR